MTMRRDNPKVVKLRTDRERTSLWLEILTKGIGNILADRCNYPEDAREVVAVVNSALVPAIDAAQAASEAYMPYRRMRRVRIRPAKKNKAKKTT